MEKTQVTKRAGHSTSTEELLLSRSARSHEAVRGEEPTSKVRFGERDSLIRLVREEGWPCDEGHGLVSAVEG
jgi:hypothetical protein